MVLAQRKAVPGVAQLQCALQRCALQSAELLSEENRLAKKLELSQEEHEACQVFLSEAEVASMAVSRPSSVRGQNFEPQPQLRAALLMPRPRHPQRPRDRAAGADGRWAESAAALCKEQCQKRFSGQEAKVKVTMASRGAPSGNVLGEAGFRDSPQHVAAAFRRLAQALNLAEPSLVPRRQQNAAEGLHALLVSIGAVHGSELSGVGTFSQRAALRTTWQTPCLKSWSLEAAALREALRRSRSERDAASSGQLAMLRRELGEANSQLAEVKRQTVLAHRKAGPGVARLQCTLERCALQSAELLSEENRLAQQQSSELAAAGLAEELSVVTAARGAADAKAKAASDAARQEAKLAERQQAVCDADAAAEAALGEVEEWQCLHQAVDTEANGFLSRCERAQHQEKQAEARAERLQLELRSAAEQVALAERERSCLLAEAVRLRWLAVVSVALSALIGCAVHAVARARPATQSEGVDKATSNSAEYCSPKLGLSVIQRAYADGKVGGLQQMTLFASLAKSQEADAPVEVPRAETEALWVPRIGTGWCAALEAELRRPSISQIVQDVDLLRANPSNVVCPPREKVFQAFLATPLEKVR
ncbi:unnamed protein product, partial [Polarella glacialis]